MNDVNRESWKPVLTGEILLFGLLGKVLYTDLDKDWLDMLISDEVFSEAPFGADQEETQRGLEYLQNWSSKNVGGISTDEFKALKADHLYLFIGTNRVLAPVWGSVYFSEKHLVFQEQTLQVREWFARYGLQNERINKEPDDHIGLELIFLAHLASLALHAIEEDNPQEFEALMQAQHDFLFEHLLRWGPVWARLVIENAETDFYRGMAHLTHGALLAAAESLQMELPKEVLF